MSRFDQAQERDMILFVGAESYSGAQRESFQRISKILQKEITPCVLISVTDPEARRKASIDPKAVVIEADFSLATSVAKAIRPYANRFLAVTSRAERNMPLLKKTIPHVPYLNTPSESSLDWTTDKIKMRQLLRTYDKNISPDFLVVHDAEPETMDRIEKRIGFPLIIKPAGLAASLLVTLCYHREELESSLNNTVKKIEKIYKKKKGRGVPQILVEEFMEGSMFSVDSYVNQRGVIYHAPMVKVRTGRSVGFDDFFGYLRMTPVNIKPHKIDAANKAVEKAIEALNLRSTTCHTELMKTEDGWKIIELGPRIGGFRNEMYKLSYGMDHLANDILIRIPKKPILAGKKAKGYTAVMQFYAYKKGRLKSIEGVNRIRKLESFQRVNIKKEIGEMCDFARNGDDPVLDLVLCNKDRSKLLADIRRIEQTLRVHIRRPKRSVAQTV